jgi:hypothetical protein
MVKVVEAALLLSYSLRITLELFRKTTNEVRLFSGKWAVIFTTRLMLSLNGALQIYRKLMSKIYHYGVT